MMENPEKYFDQSDFDPSDFDPSDFDSGQNYENFFESDYWNDQVEKRTSKYKIPISIILDTNWWIYLANGEQPFALQEIIKKIDSSEFQLIIPEIVISEWDRRIEATKNEAQKEILNQSRNAYLIAEKLTGEEQTQFKKILNNYKSKEEERLKLVNQTINRIDEIIKSKSVIIPITQTAKDLTIKHGIEKKAPFHSNNSTADALIFFTSIEYLKMHGNREIGSSIFVSYNHKDFSKSTIDKDIIHDDLEIYLKETNTIFERNLGKAMKLTDKMLAEINEFVKSKVLMELESEYIEQQISDHIQNMIDIRRGK